MRRSIGTIDSSSGDANAGRPYISSKVVEPSAYTSAPTVGR
jgi:hypothetical protein